MSDSDDGCGVGLGWPDENELDDEVDLDRRHATVESPETAALRTDVNVLTMACTALGAAVLFLSCWIWTTRDAAARHDIDPESVWSGLDQTEAQLLKLGRHCFSGPEVMGAARQRALAGIDRYRWQNQQERLEKEERASAEGVSRVWAVEPSHPEAYLLISRPRRDEDALKCFDIELPRGGPYLPFGM